MQTYKNTLIINLIGGPCCGKSTISAELFSRLKKMGIKCELCPEYIKDRIYESNMTITKNQIAIFGMEHYGISTKIGKVDCIIHDGSFINNIEYNCEDNPKFNELVLSEYNRYNNLDFFIDRGTIPFEDYGRIHDLDQSKNIDKDIKKLYEKYGLKYIQVESRDAVDKMIPIILEKIKNLHRDD